MKPIFRTPRSSHTAAALTGWLILASSAAVLSRSDAADWPHWRGPSRNGKSAEVIKPWGPAGPKRLWSAQIGEGYSGVAVVGNRVYTMGNAGGKDTVFCLDAGTGKEVWRYSYRQGAGDYGGPRGTPAVDGSIVYTLSRDGIACSIGSKDGKLVWQKDLRRELNLEVPRWGFAGSPLVHAGKIIYNLGSSGVALDGRGKVVWKSGRGAAGYATPVPYTAGGQKGIAVFAGRGLVGVDANNGRVLWQHPWETSYDVNAADPVFVGDTVFISSNYGRGGALLRLAGGRPSVVWENRNMRNHFNSSVYAARGIFGNDENTLKCLDYGTGQERWRMRGGLGKGGLTVVGDKLLVLTERGELVLANATPAAYQELARARVMGGQCWTHPVVANGKIFCRNHEGELVCLSAG